MNSAKQTNLKSLNQLLKELGKQLSSEADARALIQHHTAYSRSDLILHGSEPVSEALLDTLQSDTERLLRTQKPLAYHLQHTEFMGHRYCIEEGVLIPRPETELLVETAISMVTKHQIHANDLLILDIGFGSGIIGLECALAFPQSRVYGWDISEKALQVAEKNKALLGVKNIQFFKQDIKNALDDIQALQTTSTYSLLVSNPPYIPSQDINDLDASVRDHEPHIALDGGEDGLDFYKKLSPLTQHPQSAFLAEFGMGQKPSLSTLFPKASFLDDYNGIPRIMILDNLNEVVRS